MTTLFEEITTVITKIMTLLGTVSKNLMSNELFQLTLGIVILSILIALIFYIIQFNKKIDNHRRLLIKNGFKYNGVEAKYWTNKQVKEHYLLNKKYK